MLLKHAWRPRFSSISTPASDYSPNLWWELTSAWIWGSGDRLPEAPTLLTDNLGLLLPLYSPLTSQHVIPPPCCRRRCWAETWTSIIRQWNSRDVGGWVPGNTASRSWMVVLWFTTGQLSPLTPDVAWLGLETMPHVSGWWRNVCCRGGMYVSIGGIRHGIDFMADFYYN